MVGSSKGLRHRKSGTRHTEAMCGHCKTSRKPIAVNSLPPGRAGGLSVDSTAKCNAFEGTVECVGGVEESLTYFSLNPFDSFNPARASLHSE